MNTTYKGFAIEDLQSAFEAVCDPSDWKKPIAATMPGEAVMLAVAAIEFMTATVPTVSLDVRSMRYLVESVGYRAGPAGDH